ncbi:hypothetical protein MBOU_09570 [Mycobacterium bourgelatii]|uniref:PPE family protein n=2 Tax=Mycobacterium bourgelatii TaxID=1273442 RepID=A0A7I9YJQ5_MYCBU|nr:hypothetical protein MBOU_09570 [Mycobacterium bourgelatii]
MSAAAASYVVWLRATAAQAEETSAQAKAAAAAYQTAFSATVPPPIVAANRTQLLTLIATNVFGINTQAIAATEAQYAEMWAQDAAAMYAYAASSASATTLTPFNPPPQTTDPSGLAEQAAAGQAGSLESSVQRALSAVPGALQSAATPAAAAEDPLVVLAVLADLSAIVFGVTAGIATLGLGVPAAVLGIVNFPVAIFGTMVGVHTDEILSDLEGVEPLATIEPEPDVKPLTAPVRNMPPGAVSSGSISANLGEAKGVGALSVPPTWTIATPAVRPVSYTLPALSDAAVKATAAPAPGAGSGSSLGEMALAGMAGGAMAGFLGPGVGLGGGKGAKKTAAPARARAAETAGGNVAAGENGEAPDDKPRAVVTGVAAELREFAKLRDEGILTDEEFTEQKNRLLGR